MKEEREGKDRVFITKGRIKVTRYYSATNCSIEFCDYNYTRHNVRWYTIEQGTIKNPYLKKIFGVGYLGEGQYNMASNSKIYRCWYNMMNRCYNKNTRDNFPTYEKCEVCEEWHNFQNFAKWYEENYYQVDSDKMCLDKDILHKGNTLYSPETCVFVPQQVNKLFTKRQRYRGECCIGVWKKEEGFCAGCTKHGKNINLGRYSTQERAFNVYKKFKEELIKEMAEELKCKIPSKLYLALINYSVEIDD